MKFALYTGCAAKGACPELYQSTMVVARHLGIEFVELEDAACCGAGVVQEGDPDLGLTLNARTFSMAEELGLDILTICGTCQGVMGKDHATLTHDPAAQERVATLLARDGREYHGRIQVKHFLWVLVRDYGIARFRTRVTRRLQNLRVAPFYGCYILRPSWALGFDDPTNPTSLEQVIDAVGAEPVDYAGKTKCCGFPVLLENEAMASGMAGSNLADAKDQGADCLVTPCPLCHMSLDLYQGRAESAVGRRLNLPILHLTQLIGLALGCTPHELGLERHLVSVQPVLEKLGLP